MKNLLLLFAVCVFSFANAQLNYELFTYQSKIDQKTYEVLIIFNGNDLHQEVNSKIRIKYVEDGKQNLVDYNAVAQLEKTNNQSQLIVTPLARKIKFIKGSGKFQHIKYVFDPEKYSAGKAEEIRGSTNAEFSFTSQFLDLYNYESILEKFFISSDEDDYTLDRMKKLALAQIENQFYEGLEYGF